MGTYRVEWPCCESVTITEAWEPDRCPFCYEPPMEASALVLYDALEECKRVLSDLQSTQLEGTRTRAAWEKARAALAKAKGE